MNYSRLTCLLLVKGSVYLNCFWVLLKIVYLRGLHYSRPCIWRSYCIRFRNLCPLCYLCTSSDTTLPTASKYPHDGSYVGPCQNNTKQSSVCFMFQGAMEWAMKSWIVAMEHHFQPALTTVTAFTGASLQQPVGIPVF